MKIRHSFKLNRFVFGVMHDKKKSAVYICVGTYILGIYYKEKETKTTEGVFEVREDFYTRNCDFCGKEYRVKKTTFWAGYGRCCSNPCKAELRKIRKPKNKSKKTRK